MKIHSTPRLHKPSLLGTATLAATLLALPAPAKAEPTTTAVAAVVSAGWLAVITAFHGSSRDHGYPMASSSDSGAPRPYVIPAHAVNLPPANSPAFGSGGMIYSSVSPLATTNQTQAQVQPVVRMETAPVAYYAVPSPGLQVVTPVSAAYGEPRK
ncbi:hypothetical protein SIID45300_03321 [Candidatus Magnetaquicoccaceae bacterium FCR-1]|uniref:Secreted protein n=1 Tax=Candidatus Magnetaquiglobus chichijimensis TaxID=3141448 RepID=A0ABQ0CDJ0_9PROT